MSIVLLCSVCLKYLENYETAILFRILRACHQHIFRTSTALNLLSELLVLLYSIFQTPLQPFMLHRGGSRAVATSKVERFEIIVNGIQPLAIITKRPILNAAAALDSPLLHQSELSFRESAHDCQK